MSTNVTDLTALFRARGAHRRREPAPDHYEALLLRNLTVDELKAALRPSGLVVSKIHGQAVVHQAQTPPNDAA